MCLLNSESAVDGVAPLRLQSVRFAHTFVPSALNSLRSGSLTLTVLKWNQRSRLESKNSFFKIVVRTMHALCYLSQQLLESFDGVYGDIDEDLDVSLKSGIQSTSTTASRSILEEIIEITERPFGIRFNINNHNNQYLTIEEVLLNSLRSRLQRGDKLTKINEIKLTDLTPSAALNLFNQTQLPFKATFEKSVLQFIGDSFNSHSQSKDIDIANQIEPINLNSTPLPPLPIHGGNNKNNDNIKQTPNSGGSWIDSKDFNFDDLDVLGFGALKNMRYLDYDDTPMPGLEQFTPYSPKFSDSEYSGNDDISPRKSGSLSDSNGFLRSPTNKSRSKSSSKSKSRHKKKGNTQFRFTVDEEEDLEETSASDCSFSFGSLSFGNDQSFNSSSIETPMPTSPMPVTQRPSAKYAKLKDANYQSIALLKDLLGDGKKAKEAKMRNEHEQKLGPLSPDPIDISELDDIYDSLPPPKNDKNTNISQNNKKFLRKYLWMDPKGIFDEYLCHNINDEDSNIVIGDATPTTKCQLQ